MSNGYDLRDNLGLVTRFITTSGGPVTIPSGAASAEAAADNILPHSYAADVGLTYQQVYDSSAWPGARTITGVAFRPDGSYGHAWTKTLAGVVVRLSTTTRAVGALQADPTANRGGDAVTVFSADLALSSAFSGSAGGPMAADLVITFSTPFTYNPGSGNLLLEIELPAFSGEALALDAVLGSGVTSRAIAFGS